MREILLRAWHHLATFEGLSTFRAWLYRIATNVCPRQRTRWKTDRPVLPLALAEAAARSTEPPINVSPYPDALLDELAATSDDPAAEYDLRESVHLAFLAAVQVLRPDSGRFSSCATCSAGRRVRWPNCSIRRLRAEATVVC